MLRGIAANLIPWRLRPNEDMHLDLNSGIAVDAAQSHAMHLALVRPAQPGAAGLAKDPVHSVGGGKAACLAFDGQGARIELRASEEGRTHRLLAVAAVTDTHVDRPALRLETNRAAQAAAFSCHDTYLKISSCYLWMAAGGKELEGP